MSMCPSVRFVGGWGRVGGFNPPMVDDDPQLVTAKFGLGVGFGLLIKVQNPNSSLNPYELSDIIQTHLRKLFCNGLTATSVLLLCLITFKQSFNEGMLFSLQMLCVCIIVKCPQSTSSVIADVKDYYYIDNVYIPHVFSPLHTTGLW